MALKDWKRINKHRWEHKYGNSIVINSNIIGHYVVREWIGGFDISIADKKTHAQALKFAKSYMRTH